MKEIATKRRQTMKDEKTARLFQTAEGHWHWVPASWDVNIPMGAEGHKSKAAALRAAATEGMEWFLVSYAWPRTPAKRIPRKYRDVITAEFRMT